MCHEAPAAAVTGVSMRVALPRHQHLSVDPQDLYSQLSARLKPDEHSSDKGGM